ncbi:MAG: TonB-dependent receptor plug domain-containing protein [Tannerellaceae bacterium]|nr:TonB-dependent receptor plug domain-containing protein [Tannerellaceae bacterium]
MSLSTQQAGKVTGIVEDELGSVAGASVVVKGTTNGTITDMNGQFTLEGVTNGAVIQVSFIGYATQEVKYTGQPSLVVKLQEDTQALSEVVVTALGMTRDKKALGYAITELKGDDLLKSNVVNPVNALQGKVAGVQINMGIGGPQTSQRILIRGNTSISNNNQPIFVIDGIIIDNDLTKTGGKEERDFGNDIKNLNPDDFESVSVLKGAAATALYGSRASNGVVLITTKKGQKGEGLGISFSHTQQWEKVYSTPSFQNEFGSGMNPVWDLNSDGSENRNITSTSRSWGPRFDGLPFTYNNTFEGIYQPYKNNLKDMYRTGRSNNTNVAISGGTDKSTFRFSFSNRSEDGIWPVNTMDRNSLSINASHDISKIVSVEAGFAYTNLKSKDPIPQRGDASPVYDYVFRVPRFYDTNYWKIIIGVPHRTDTITRILSIPPICLACMKTIRSKRKITTGPI